MDREQLRSIMEEETRLAVAAGETNLKPERLVKRARAKAHPLHDSIWGVSDAKLAMAARLDIARGLMSVYVTLMGKTTPGLKVTVPMMVHDTAAPAGQTGYRLFTDVQESRTESYATLEQELRALRGHYVRCMSIAAALGLADEARAGIASWDALMGALVKRGVVVPVEKPARKRRENESRVSL